MKKKMVAVLMVSALICSMAAGCGSSSEKGTEGANNSKTSDNATIHITSWNEPSTDDALNMYKQCEKATGIKVDVTVIPESDYSSKLNQMVSTGDDSMDIFIAWENDLKNFADAGGILSLDDYLSGSSIDTNDMIDAVAKLSDGLGGTYGLPWCAATEIMYYNQDMFDAAKIDYPTNDWSYSDYLVAAEKLTQYNEDGSTDVYGAALPNTQTWWAGIGGAGDQVYDPSTGKLVIGDGAESFITDCKNLVDKGVMPEPSSDTADLFAAGKCAMSWAGSWNISTYGDTLGFNWDIATIPTNKVKYNTLHTGFYTINAKSKNADNAWKVIEYLMGEEGQTINSKASGNPSALKSIAAKGAWKVESATTIENWDAMTDSLESGVFGYTCLPSGVTGNGVSTFNSALLGQTDIKSAVKSVSDYAAETIGY